MAELFFGSSTICFVGGFVVLVLYLAGNGIRLVPEDKRLDVYRLGRKVDQRGPGLVFMIPIIERARTIDFADDES